MRIPAGLVSWKRGIDDFDITLQDRASRGIDFDVRIVKLLACDSSSRACETTGGHRSLVNKER